MENIKVNVYDKNYEMAFYSDKYLENNNTYVGIRSKEEGCNYFEEWGDLTVNLSQDLPEGRAYLHINHLAPEILKALKDRELIKPLGITCRSGFVDYPMYDISKLLQEIEG